MAATIKQVAARAGVSTATVSYVLNGVGTVTEATRARVRAAAAALNYQPSHAARSLRGRSHTLGLALPALPGRLADPALAATLASLMDAAALRGYSLLLATESAEQGAAEMCLNLARTSRVDGLVLLDMQTDDERALALCAAGIPHVCAGPPPNDGSPAVIVDGRAAAAAAMQHLFSLGHRRIGLIQIPSELAESEPRYAGYGAALEEARISADPSLVVEAGRREEDGYQAMQELLGLPEPPTAVLSCSDELAFGAMHALYDAGREIGRDVSLVGFDDVPLAAHVHPALTTLRQPRRKIGEALAALLIDAIEGHPRETHIITLDARLVVRRSTGRRQETGDRRQETGVSS